MNVFEQMLNVETFPVLSQSVLDYSTQVLTNDIQNETLRNRFQIKEHCTFVVHPDNPNW